jgi:hypothetical protein
MYMEMDAFLIVESSIFQSVGNTTNFFIKATRYFFMEVSL